MQFNHNPFASVGEAIKIFKQRIDEEAGAARARYITSVQGQEAVYIEKMRQAKEYIANGYPNQITGYEMILAESNARETSMQEAADFIKFTADNWNNVLSPAIEELRIGSKNKIDNLPNSASIQDVVNIAYSAIASLKAI